MEAVNIATKIADIETLVWVVFVMGCVGTAIWGVKFFWWRVQKSAEKEDYMPKLIETLSKVADAVNHLSTQQIQLDGTLERIVDRLERQEEREERRFTSIMTKLDDVPKRGKTTVVRVVRHGESK